MFFEIKLNKSPLAKHSRKILGILGILVLKTAIFLVGATEKNINHDESPWSSMLSPAEAYKEYLTYSGEEVTGGILHNQRTCNLLGAFYHGAEPQEPSLDHIDVVETAASQFSPLSSFLMPGRYCSKMMIRNFKGDVRIIFNNKVYHRTLSINMPTESAQSIKCAYRTIVPSTFRSCPSLAGPMGFHEKIIDATDLNDLSTLELSVHSQTPFQFDIQNCSGD